MSSERATRSVRKEDTSLDAVTAAKLAAQSQQRKSTRVTRPKTTPTSTRKPAAPKVVVVKQEVVVEKEKPVQKVVRRDTKAVKPAAAPVTRVRLKSEKDPPATPEDVEDNEEESGELFCICRQPYDPRRFMIGCDKCYGWFHARCVNVTTTEATRIKCFVCPPCRKKAGGESEPEDTVAKKAQPVVKRERPPELEGKPRVFPLSKEGASKSSKSNVHRNKLMAKRQKLAKERAQSGKDVPEKGDIVVQIGPDETDPEDSGDSSTGMYLSSEDDSDSEITPALKTNTFTNGVSEEDRWGENRQTWTSFIKSYVAGPTRTPEPVLELDLNDTEGRELRNLAKKEEGGIVDYKLDVDDDFGEWSKFSSTNDANENDSARIAWMEQRREEVERELLLLQKSRFLYDGALAFSIRKTFLRGMDYSIADIMSSPLLQGIGGGGVNKGKAQKTQNNEHYQTLWRDMLSCRGCLGHIPSYRYAEHVERCCEQPGPRGLWTVKGTQEPLPKSTVCGCPLSLAELKGYCPRDSEMCAIHYGWRPKLKQKIEKKSFSLSRRLRLISAELIVVQKRVKERESRPKSPPPKEPSASVPSASTRSLSQTHQVQHHQAHQPHPHHQHQHPHQQQPIHSSHVSSHPQHHHSMLSHYPQHSAQHSVHQQQQQAVHHHHHHQQQHTDLQQQHNMASSHHMGPLQQQQQHSHMLQSHNPHMHSHLQQQQASSLHHQSSSHHHPHQLQLLPQMHDASHLPKQQMMMMPGMQPMQMMGPGMGQMMLNVQPHMRMDRGQMGMDRGQMGMDRRYL